MSVVQGALERKEGVVTVGDGWDQIFSQFEGDFLIGRDVGKWFYHTKYRNVIWDKRKHKSVFQAREENRQNLPNCSEKQADAGGEDFEEPAADQCS